MMEKAKANLLFNGFDMQFFADQGYVGKSTIGAVDRSAQGSRLEIRVDKEIANLNPQADPFISMLLKARKGTVDTKRFEYYDEAPMAWWTRIDNALGYNAAADEMVVDDASIMAPGTIIKIPRTGEEIRVGTVDVATNTIDDLIRGYGSTNAAAILDDDQIFVMPNAMGDGYTTPTAMSVQPTMFWNYVQTLNTPIMVTEDAEEVAKRAGGSERDRLRRNALFQHRIGMERVALFGERYNDATNQILKTGGLRSRLSTNVFNLNNQLMTEIVFDDICEQTFREGSDTKVLVCGSLMNLAISRFARERIETVSGAEFYGLSLKKILTGDGHTLLITQSKLFREYYAGWGFIVDMKNIKLRMFKDTVLRKDLQNKTVHGYIDEYETKFGVEVRLEQTHGVIQNARV